MKAVDMTSCVVQRVRGRAVLRAYSQSCPLRDFSLTIVRLPFEKWEPDLDTRGVLPMTNETQANSGIGRDEIRGIAQMPETGDFAVDCATGRACADSLILRMAETRCTPALGAVVRELMKGGRWEAIHIGFFQRLADRSVQVLT